jgi:hypothetical protein
LSNWVTGHSKSTLKLQGWEQIAGGLLGDSLLEAQGEATGVLLGWVNEFNRRCCRELQGPPRVKKMEVYLVAVELLSLRSLGLTS